MTCVRIKDLSPEERRIHYNKHQKKYDNWLKISKEFRNICREETEEEIREREIKKTDSERKRMERKEEKQRLKAEEKEQERLERKKEKNKKHYAIYKKDIQQWRIDNREHYNKMANIRQKRYYERKKLRDAE